MSTFDEAFEALIGHEGGYSDNPADPGGRTKYGISQRSYPTVDIKNLTLDQAKAIYRRDYWDKVSGDKLPPALALIAFDAAVNSGVKPASEWLQRALGVPDDGVIGPKTLAAAMAVEPNPVALDRVCALALTERLLFMASLPTWPTFRKGWVRRLFTLSYQSTGIA